MQGIQVIHIIVAHFTFLPVTLYFCIIRCHFHSYRFAFSSCMHFARVTPACLLFCPFITWFSHCFRVAVARFSFFHVLYLPQARPRADCCTPGICLFTVFAILSFCFAQSSRANGVEVSGQTTCGLLHTCHVSIYSQHFKFSVPLSSLHSLHLYRTKFTCERG
jgi:hypothetical protein